VNETTEIKRRPIDTKLDWALYWHRFGFKVAACHLSVSRPSAMLLTEKSALDEEAITARWTEHPDGAIACVGGPDVVMLTTESEEALTRLRRIEREHQTAPLLQVRAAAKTHHLFRLAASREAVAAFEDSGIAVTILPDAQLPSEPGTVKPISDMTADRLQDANPAFLSAVAASRPGDAIAEPEADPLPLSEAEPAAPRPVIPESVPDPTNPLSRYSLLGRADEIAEFVTATCYVLPDVALRGQATAIYAAPNTGKTALTLKLLMDAITTGEISAAEVYYVNADDSAAGLFEKAQIADQYGFQTLAEGFGEFTSTKLSPVLDELIASGKAKSSIVIIDTLKRFTDTMDKTATRKFTGVVRKFVAKGGTLIALSHVNKKPNDKGRAVYAGATDIVDDFDCAYIVEEVSRDGTHKVVMFRNIKKRGPVADQAAFRYLIEPNLSYAELLLSIERVGEADLQPLQTTLELKSDRPIIRAIEAAIREGINQKMALVLAVGDHLRASRRTVLKVLDKYEGQDPANHRWTFTVKERGAKVFALLPDAAPLPPD